MAQNFLQQGAPVETGLVREYVANLQTNTDTLRSNFSGSTFPATPVAGQHCYRIDMGIEYVYDGQDWKEVPAASSLSAEMKNARGSMPSLWDRLNVAINADGTLKNPIAAEIDEWKDTAIAPAYVSDNQFSVEGDLTSIFTKGRSVKIFRMDGETGVISTSGVTTVISSTASNGTTIVKVADSIVTSDIYEVKYGLLQETITPQRNSLQRLTVYDVDDIAYTNKLKSYMYLSCIEPGTTGEIEPSYKNIITPSSVGEATNLTMITTNGGTTGTVTSGGTFTGVSNETIYVKLSTSTPGASETYEMITLSYCVGSQTGTYTEVGLADGEPQEIVDGVTVQLGITGMYEDGETYSIACIAEVSEPLDVGDTITDGTVTWKIRKISSADGMPIGAILPFAGNGDIPSGYLLCDGAAVSRTMFPDLFATIGTTYGAGDGSTTFNLPDYNTAQRFAQGGTVAGTVKEAGLPNITASMTARGFESTTPRIILNSSGALAQSNSGSSSNPAASYNSQQKTTYVTFDASRSSSVYGNSDTVQPNALTVRYIIKAFDGQTADSALIDITQYAQELAGKVDRFDMYNPAAAHNALYRGKDLTEYWESGEMSAAIADGSFRDIYPGDYIIKTVTINGTTYSNVKFIVMDLDYFQPWSFGGTDKHHIVMMPEGALGTQYMNSTNITTGGYVGSYMHATHIPKVNTGIVAAFGSAHVLSHQEYLTNTVDTSKPSGAGGGYTGCATNWAAVSGLKCCLCSENMVYGGRVWGSSIDTGCASKQLAAFRHNQQLRKTTSFWLRAVSNSTAFAYANYAGYASNYSASAAFGVRPYFPLA